MQSFGPICDYFSKEVDCVLILGKLGGSLTKTPGEPVSLDYGRWIVIWRSGSKMGCDLILAVDFRSDGAGGFWAHGRRWAAAGDEARGGGSLEKVDSGLPVAESGRG